MDKTNSTSNLLFGIFFLREQLHNFLDIFEENLYEIAKHIEYDNAIMLLETKRLMVRLVEKQLELYLNAPIEDASVFHPPKQFWLDISEIHEGRNSELIKSTLLTFDKKIMAWSYLLLVNEDTSIELSGFLL